MLCYALRISIVDPAGDDPDLDPTVGEKNRIRPSSMSSIIQRFWIRRKPDPDPSFCLQIPDPDLQLMIISFLYAREHRKTRTFSSLAFIFAQGRTHAIGSRPPPSCFFFK